MAEPMEAEEFLELVWGEYHGWVDLPAKVGDYWVPWNYEWDGDADLPITRRIDSCLRDEESLYFSVAMFTKKGRRIEDVKPTAWLWADLDDVHPTVARDDGLLPTIAWESSPGRFQALWRLDRRLRPETLAKLNQALTYHLGADLGGWDLTQVLRLPGTRNFKYSPAPEVTLLWANNTTYDPREVWAKVRASLPDETLPDGQNLPDGPRPARPMPARVRALLRVPSDSVVEGERSSQLWAIECLLAEAGWGEDDIYRVVSVSAWNKWAKVATGERRLRTEIRKALAHVRRKATTRRDDSDRRPSGGAGVLADGAIEAGGGGEEPVVGAPEGDEPAEDTVPDLPFVRYSSFMAMEITPPRWLIEDIWTAGSHGIFGGEPKTSKTTVSLAMSLSVASGRPFLGKYRVATPGPVLMVQEENAPVDMQDKLRKLAFFSGLIRAGAVDTRRAARGSLGKRAVTLDFPDEVPLRLLNNWGFDLTQEEHREALWAEVDAVRPVLVVLDPLYLLLPGVNLNQSHEVTPYLKWLLLMRNEFGCAVQVIHHQGKVTVDNAGRRSGQRLMGSALFHGWVDSAIYTSAVDLREERPGWLGVQLEREFRTMPPQKDLQVAMFLGKPGDIDRMQVEVQEWGLQDSILAYLENSGDTTARKVAEALGLDVKVVVGRAKEAGYKVTPRKYPTGVGFMISSNGAEKRGIEEKNEG